MENLSPQCLFESRSKLFHSQSIFMWIFALMRRAREKVKWKILISEQCEYFSFKKFGTCDKWHKKRAYEKLLVTAWMFNINSTAFSLHRTIRFIAQAMQDWKKRSPRITYRNPSATDEDKTENFLALALRTNSVRKPFRRNNPFNGPI